MAGSTGTDSMIKPARAELKTAETREVYFFVSARAPLARHI
jgi:hypothetical protein